MGHTKLGLVVSISYRLGVNQGIQFPECGLVPALCPADAARSGISPRIA